MCKVYIIILAILVTGCEREFLDKKPNIALVVPATLKDYQALLDNIDGGLFNHPSLSTISGDEYLIKAERMQTLPEYEQRSYTWEKDIFSGSSSEDWNRGYKAVFTTNIVVEGLDNIRENNEPSEWNAVKGSALFYRAFSFFNLTQHYAAPFDKQSAANLPGIPIRLKADINEVNGRGTLMEAYDQIVNDLLLAIDLLPENRMYKNRPCRPAAMGLLSRVYLSMKDYTQAAEYATACLNLKNELVNFNTVDIESARPFVASPSSTNAEVLYFSSLINYLFFVPGYAEVDTVLYNSYHENDLRKKCYFDQLDDGSITFKGSYAGDFGLFGGIATDEMYLIRAECLARQGQTSEALNDLNHLLEKRWLTGTFIPFTAETPEEALTLILSEARKELLMRGVRWSYLRRLNSDPDRAVTLRRVLDQQEYILLPLSKRYVFPIPDNEILTSKIEQNER